MARGVAGGPPRARPAQHGRACKKLPKASFNSFANPRFSFFETNAIRLMISSISSHALEHGMAVGGAAAAAAARRHGLGRAVQVDPIKSTLKASGTNRLTLLVQSDGPLSNVAFNFNLRRYKWASTLANSAAYCGTGAFDAAALASVWR